MRIVCEQRDMPGLPLPNEVSMIVSDELPERQGVTGAFVLAFQGEALLLTQLKRRGWDIPGGHIEPGETPAETMRRECYEETGAVLDASGLLGYQRIRLHGTKPDGYPYPHPDSYLVFYWATIARLEEVQENDEVQGRGLFAPREASDIPWIKANTGMYEEALAMARKSVEAAR
ncbi:NUDIX hydrolase [Paenibacillus hodogayensis]|uniref:NUDIX hydrolase n=1 Tax=Paenibacillus hodogayensis TaxID=279208 RepID=A0ABV5W425_9BACL